MEHVDPSKDTEATSDAEPDAKAEKAKHHGRTTGEKWYEAINFTAGKVCILAATAAIAYVAAYGKEKYGPVPNVLNKVMKGINKLRGPWAEEADRLAGAVRRGEPGVTQADSRKADFKAIFGGSLSGAVILWWGGTSFAPIMRSLENNKEKVSNWFNKRFGKPGEEEIAHERLKDNPPQTWGDMLKGRVAAFAFAFTAFSSACFLLGRVKTPTDKGNYPLKFDYYEDKVGRLTAGLTEKGRDIAKTPMTIELTEAQKTNPLYRLGKIFAIDFYATSLAILVWNFTSRRSARQRQEAAKAAHHVTAAIAAPAQQEQEEAAHEGEEKRHVENFSKSSSHSHAVQFGKNELSLSVG